MIYIPDIKIRIRTMEFENNQTIFDYQNSLKVEERSKKYVFNAEFNGKTAGYITLNLNSDKGPFAWRDIPELEELHVFPEFRGLGVGNMLLDAAEEKAAEVSNTITVCVGLHSGYGVAHRMYIRRGYMPDGSGVWYEGEPLKPYAKCCNNKNLVIYLLKELNNN
ncbi:Acetyltransferase (GNAT) family protein [Anaerocolumna jejuensis DSM 15929]|uniref:Acetyltransferase (GNAT) family protein n=1 Tax=Anaerocolumna jejuensis DSM 15929 TaxID=1121322 RepID=A0A1M7ABS8_9FIRM|nr:GNAT family N-acetyltransferase [Anaerocolumna jejuensis]SHL40128.1 Acetyltransferase (GNAT) family protein [Anaerocolumna jejuensis DSM 15929]